MWRKQKRCEISDCKGLPQRLNLRVARIQQEKTSGKSYIRTIVYYRSDASEFWGLDILPRSVPHTSKDYFKDMEVDPPVSIKEKEHTVKLEYEIRAYFICFSMVVGCPV